MFSIQDGYKTNYSIRNGTWQPRNQGETKDIIRKYKDLIESVNLKLTSEEIDVLIPSSKINSRKAQKAILKQASEEKVNTRAKPKSPDIM